MYTMNNVFCVFDTETNGLLSHPNIRIVSIAWIIGKYSKKTNTIKVRSPKYYIVLPEDYVIDEESKNIHGITHERALSEGISCSKIILEMLQDIERYKVSFLIGHNVEFDREVVLRELERLDIDNVIFKSLHTICTMRTTYKMLNMSKYPKLIELIVYFFPDYDISGAHDALWDTRVCLLIFTRLLQMSLDS
jgi:DNA polymerase III epsilon subunit-like protein